MKTLLLGVSLGCGSCLSGAELSQNLRVDSGPVNGVEIGNGGVSVYREAWKVGIRPGDVIVDVNGQGRQSSSQPHFLYCASPVATP